MNIEKLKEALKLMYCLETKEGCCSGDYVLVRSRNEGINAGFIAESDATSITLTNVRRLWYFKPKDKNKSWYEGVALSGVSSDSKLSEIVSKKKIVEDYSITYCTPEAAKSIQEAPAYEP